MLALEVIMNDSWTQETTSLIEELSKELDNITSKIEHLILEKQDIEQQISAAETLIRIYRNKHQNESTIYQDIPKGYFGDKSYSEMLKEIAVKLGGVFKVVDAAEILLQAGVSDSKRTIQSNIYAVIRRNPEKFKKLKEGEYRYTNGSSVVTKSIQGTDKQHSRVKSGIQKAIKEIKDKNPQMTKKEVLNYLINNGFDFKGKKSVNAVNMTWAKLGYHKEGKQQSLLV